jgi:hypothetical protein
MWLDALDGGPGLRPLTLVVGDRTTIVLAIAREHGVSAGARLVIRCQGADVLASIEPTLGRDGEGPKRDQNVAPKRP